MRLRPIERAAYFRGWSEKKNRGLIHGASGAFGNAATRIEAFIAGGGTYVYGSYPDKVIVAPIWLNAGLSGLGLRVEESGIGLIAGFAWSGPYEDVKLKSR